MYLCVRERICAGFRADLDEAPELTSLLPTLVALPALLAQANTGTNEEYWGAAKVKITPHGFQSHQVERIVGAALHDKYKVVPVSMPHKATGREHAHDPRPAREGLRACALDTCGNSVMSPQYTAQHSLRHVSEASS